MGQDLRNLFKAEDEKYSQIKMSEGHEARFLKKLDNVLPENASIKKRFSVLQIAASIVVLIGIVVTVYKFSQQPNFTDNTVVVNDNQTKEDQLKSLGDISPDLKIVEDYYLANINLELSKIKQTPENKELFDGYVIRLAELNQEYKRLSVDLTENGPNELTVSALIDNLKLRLNLLYRLKEQLHELNASDEAKLNS